MPTRRRHVPSIDDKLERTHKKSDSRAYETLHERQLLELFAPHFEAELSRKLLRGTANVLNAAISYHQCVQLVGQKIDSATMESSRTFVDLIRDHRTRLDAFDRWTVLSEPDANRAAATLDLNEHHTAVLSSEVVGSEALFGRDVKAVCGCTDELISIEDARVCACGAIVAKRGRLKRAVSRFGHCCMDREAIGKSVVSRAILSLPHFPFSVLTDKHGTVIAPVHVACAFALMHHKDVLPVFPFVSTEDAVFWKRNASLCLRLMEAGSTEMRSSSRPVHLCPPAPQVAAHSLMTNGCFKGRCTFVNI
jgi:hypothetical protein